LQIVVISTCTGNKLVNHHPRQLTQSDFEKGSAHVASRESELSELLAPAGEMYTGGQHVKLMEGVHRYRAARPANLLSLWIVSPGYGVLPEVRLIAPYDATFEGMDDDEIWRAAQLRHIPDKIREILGQPYDFRIILLSKHYLSAARLDLVSFGGPTVAFCAASAVSSLRNIANLTPVLVGNTDAKRFRCIGYDLKGEVAKRLLCIADRQSGALLAMAASPRRLLVALERYRC
jgi:hypothetical protein